MAAVLSVAIINFETPDLTANCVAAVHRNPPAEPYEVVVVDNGSRAAMLPELRAVAGARDLRPEAVRELLALQASDWAFVVSRDQAPPYGRERAAGHAAALAAGGGDGPRSLAPGATAGPLLAP